MTVQCADEAEDFVSSFFYSEYDKAIGGNFKQAWATEEDPRALVLLIKGINTPKHVLVRIPLHVFVRIAIALAEAVLPKFEEKYPNDPRPRQAIEAAKNWIEKPNQENREAAWTAADSALDAANATYTDSTVVWVAWTAFSAAKASGADYASHSAVYAADAAKYVVLAGLPKQEACNIIRRIAAEHIPYLSNI